MLNVKEITPGTRTNGLTAFGHISVKPAQWIGGPCLTVTSGCTDSRLANRRVNSDDEASYSLAGQVSRPWSFGERLLKGEENDRGVHLNGAVFIVAFDPLGLL